MSAADGTQRDWGRYGLGAALAGWIIAFLPAVVPAAFLLWCLGLVWGVVGWRRSRSGYGLAGIVAACFGFGYIIAGIVLGLVFF